VTYFHEVHHLPYGRPETVLGEVFHLDIAADSLVNLVRRTGTALKPQAEAIRLEVVQSAVIGSDETGAHVDGQNQWQWVFRDFYGTIKLDRELPGAEAGDEQSSKFIIMGGIKCPKWENLTLARICSASIA